MEKKVFKLDFYGREIIVEHGQVAKQADGVVLVRYGDTVVLSTATATKTATPQTNIFLFLIMKSSIFTFAVAFFSLDIFYSEYFFII